MRVPLTSLLVLLLGGVALAGTLPSGTVVVVEIDDIEETLNSLRSGPAHRLWTETPAVKGPVDELLGTLRKDLETKVEQARRFLGFALGERDEVLALPDKLRGRVTIGLVAGEVGTKLEPVLRYTARTEKEADALRSAVAVLEAAVLRIDPENRIEIEEGVSTFRDPGGVAKLAWAFRGNELVAAPGPHLVRLTLEAPGEARDLWRDGVAKAVVAAGGGSGLRAWMNVGAAARMAENGAFDEGFRNLLVMLEVLGVRSVSAASGFTADGGRDAIHLSAPEDSMISRYVRESVVAPWPAAGPAGTMFSISLGASPDDLLSFWMEYAERTNPAAFAKTREGLENLLIGLGVDLREDVLAKLGGGMVLHFVPGKAGPVPLASAPILDRDALLLIGSQVAEAAGWRRSDREDGILWLTAETKPTGFLLGRERLFVGPLEAMAALKQARPDAPAPAAVLRETLPEGIRGLLVADHAALAPVVRKALERLHPGLGSALGSEAVTAKLGAEAIVLVPAESGVMLIHASTLAPAPVWLLLTAGR